MAISRTAQGEGERERKKLDEAKLKLAAFSDGYREDRPIVVESASQIEPHVRGMTCPVCDVSFQVAEHIATPRGRVVHARCPRCGRTPKLHFVLRASMVS